MKKEIGNTIEEITKLLCELLSYVMIVVLSQPFSESMVVAQIQKNIGLVTDTITSRVSAFKSIMKHQKKKKIGPFTNNWEIGEHIAVGEEVIKEDMQLKLELKETTNSSFSGNSSISIKRKYQSTRSHFYLALRFRHLDLRVFQEIRYFC